MDGMEEFDFNPDFSFEEEEPKPAKPEKIQLPQQQQVTAVNNAETSITMSNLVDMTKEHINDDKRVRDEIDELTGILDDAMPQMTVKEMLEYLKLKLKEREFHCKAIFDAYGFVQRMEFAREMLVGNERKERVNQALDNQRITKLMGYLNLNNEQDT